jgi:hypothetical protein
MGGGSTQNTSQTTKLSKWTGANKTIADSAISGLTDWFKNTNAAAGGADAWNNNTFSVGLNKLQDADYNRNKSLMDNAQLASIAGGGNLDVNSNPYFQKRLDAKIQTMQEAFGSSLDSVRGGFQRGGMADSSMRQNKEKQLVAQQGRTLDEFVNNAYDSEYDKRVQEMLQANSLLNQAGQAGYRYQAAEQASKDSSLFNYAKMYGLDASQKQLLMQYLQTISEPEQTTNSATTTQRNPGLTDYFSMLF